MKHLPLLTIACTISTIVLLFLCFFVTPIGKNGIYILPILLLIICAAVILLRLFSLFLAMKYAIAFMLVGSTLLFLRLVLVLPPFLFFLFYLFLFSAAIFYRKKHA